MKLHSHFRIWYWTVGVLVTACVGAGPGAAVASPVGRAVLAPVAAAGQQSTLDLPDDLKEAPPASKAPAAPGSGSASAALDQEESPFDPPAAKAPAAQTGAGARSSLDQEEAPLDAPAASGSSNASQEPVGSSDVGADEQPAEPVCDIVTATGSDGRSAPRPRQVKLLPHLLELPLSAKETYEFHVLNTSGEGTWTLRAAGNFVKRVQYYEQRMLAKAAAEFRLKPEDLARPAATFDTTDAEKVQKAPAVAAILQEALAEHDSAVQRFLRRGDEWRLKVRMPLAQALLNVQAYQIRLLVAQGRYEEAAAASDRIHAQMRHGAMGQIELRDLYKAIFLEPAIAAGRSGDFPAARGLLNEYTQRFPQNPGEFADRLRDGLIRRAQALADQSKMESDPRRAIELLEEARMIWPHLLGLDSQLRAVQDEYPVLECAYATLPQNLSPLSMSTPVERHAAALMFESLVHWTAHSPAGPHYASQLADARPAPLARGRQFRLPQCNWSDSQPSAPHLCTAEDVRWTVRLLKNLNPAGFPPAWERLIHGVDSPTNDPFAASVNLQVDHWQPLSLMDFMIVPKSCFPTCGQDLAEVAAFDANPVGTGPYRLLDRQEDRVRFQANPYYRKPGLPQIREIAFNRVEPIDAVERFLQGKIHLIYGVRREHVDQLERQGQTVVALPARSVYFLAPNYRRQTILQSQEVRLAMAHAINRKQILDQYFRPGQHPRRHAELNGPFPVESWAYHRKALTFDPAKAAIHLGTKKDEAAASRPLRLVYPGRDADTELACQEIAKQVRTLGITLELEAVEPDAFFHQVAHDHNFDLAYWRHDFDDETYWIWPLFDPSDAGPGGANIMGITPDEDLRATFADLLKHKEFTRIRTLSQQAHLQIARTAALIPLWQLETHVAVSAQVRGAVFDPVHLFENIDDWSLAGGGRAGR